MADMTQIREGQHYFSGHVIGHGLFEAQVGVYRAKLQLSRATLLSRVVGIYEGSGKALGRSYGKSHWRQYKKATLALIVANCEGRQPS